MDVRRLLRCMAVGLVLLGATACTDRNVRRPEQFPTESNLTANRNAMGVPYGQWLVLADGDRRIALFIRADDPTGHSISYRWRAVPADAASFSDPRVETFEGRTRETNGMGRVLIGNLQLDWSRATGTTGWLYWPAGDRSVRAWGFPYPDLAETPPDPEGNWWLTRP